MADIKSIQVDGIDYAIKDEAARESIGNLESAVNELSGKTGPIQRVESLDESNLKNLRDLETGSYVLYGYFRPYAGASSYLPFDNLLVNVYHVDEGSHLFEFSTANSEVNFIEILVDASAESGFTYSRTAISMLELNGLIGKLGNLNELATTEKGSVVAAINEVAASGGSGSGSSVQADMAQNDPEQPDYVKNRTHWVEGSGATIEWDGSTEGREAAFTYNELTFYKVSDDIPTYDDLIIGEFFYSQPEGLVGGSLSESAVREGVGCYSIANNWVIVVLQTEFEIDETSLSAPSAGIYFGGSPYPDIYAAKLTYGSTTYHPLDEGFIPDTIARTADIPEVNYPVTSVNGMTGDVVIEAGSGGGVTSWNDLEDKPFGEEVSKEALIESQTFARTSVEDSWTTYDTGLSIEDLVVGDTYTISIDGVLTTLVAKEWTYGTYLGDLPDAFGEYNFYFERPSSGIAIFYLPPGGAETVTLAVYKDGIVIYPIDEKYIPDSIARMEDVPEIPVTSVNGMTGDVVVGNEPFVQENVSTTIEWDGTTDERDNVTVGNYGYCKVCDLPSDDVVVTSLTTSKGITMSAGGSNFTVTEGDGATNYANGVIVVKKTTFTLNGTEYTVPSTGLYFMYYGTMVYTATIAIEYESTILDQKYVSDDIARSASFHGLTVPDAAGEAPTAAEFNALLAALREAGYLAT